MLTAERCDPRIVSWNRRTRSLQFQPDGRVVPRGLNSDIEDGASVKHSPQRPFVQLAVARPGYAESELPGDDDGDGNLTGLGHNLDRVRRSVKISG